MKFRILLSLGLFIIVSFAYAQEPPVIRVGYGFVLAGSGDIPGSVFLMGVQKELSKWSMLEVLASGTYIERTTNYGQGYKIFEKSNGIALEATYNPTIKLGPFKLYPAVGPVLRYAHEIRANQVGIEYNQGRIVNFSSNILDEKQLQLGYVLAANLDGKISKNISLGLRASVQSYHTGQRLASLGITFKNARWRF